MDELLRYYERELGTLGQHNQEFARRYPAIAAALGAPDDGGDPHLARLLQATAMFNARTAKRLDDAFGQFSDTLLEVNFPHYLRPFPSCAIARIDTDGHVVGREAVTIPRGTVMHAPEQQGVVCKFTTVYDVTLSPLQLMQVRYQAVLDAPAALQLPPDLAGAISISLDAGSAASFGAVPQPGLRLLLDGEAGFCAVLRDAMLLHARSSCLEIELADGARQWRMLRALPVRPVGFADDEALLPFKASSPAAYRLLLEYFAFPDKFNFVDLDMAMLQQYLPADVRRCTVHLLLADGHHGGHTAIAQALRPLSRQHLQTGCVPVVNLFSQAANPIRLTRTSADYPLLPSVRQAHCYEIVSVDSVRVLNESNQGARNSTLDSYYPLYSMRHGEAGGRQGRYWVVRRDEAMALSHPGYEMRMAFVDSYAQTLQDSTQTVSINLTCSNRELPCSLTQAAKGTHAGDLHHEGPASDLPVRWLRRPGKPLRFAGGAAANWRLVAQLSLNHQSLNQHGLPLLKQILELHNLPGSPGAARQIAGMLALRQRSASTWVPDESGGALVFGIEVLLTVDETAYVGAGLHAFAQVIEHFLGLTVHLCSFTRLIVLSSQSGKELLCCQPRNGSQTLM